MRKYFLAAAATALLASPATAQDIAVSKDQAAPSSTVTAPTTLAAVLPKDTPVHLMVVNEVTTKTDGVGHRFKLCVDRAVQIDGKVVIPVGATAWGTIMSAESSGNVGKSGNLAVRLLYVEVGDRKLPISGETTAKGKSGTAETVMGVLSLGVLGLFAKGNNAKIKAGELMTAFTAEDFELAQPAAASPRA